MTARQTASADTLYLPLWLLELYHPSWSTTTWRYALNVPYDVTATVDGVARVFAGASATADVAGLDDSGQLERAITLKDDGLIARLSGIKTSTTAVRARMWLFDSDNLSAAELGPLVFAVTGAASRDRGMVRFSVSTPNVGVIGVPAMVFNEDNAPGLRGVS